MAWGVTDNITPDLGAFVTGEQVYDAIEAVLLTHAAWEKVDSYVTSGNYYYIWKNLASESGLPFDWFVTFYHDIAAGVALYAIAHEHYDNPTRQTGKYMCGTNAVTPYYDPDRESWYHNAVSTLGGTTQSPAPVGRHLYSTSTLLTHVQTLVTKDAIIGSTRNVDGGFFYIGAFTSIATKVSDPMPLVFTSWQSTTGSGVQYPKYPSFTNNPVAAATSSQYWFEIEPVAIPNTNPVSIAHKDPVEQILAMSQGGKLGAVTAGSNGFDNFLGGAIMTRLWIELPLGSQRYDQTHMRGLYRHVVTPIHQQRLFSVGSTLLIDGQVYAYLGDEIWVNTEAP